VAFPTYRFHFGAITGAGSDTCGIFIPCHSGGMDMGIVNAGQLAIYEDIPKNLRDAVETWY